MWTSTGISRRDRNFEFRTAPSAGALFPVETYLSIQNVVNANNDYLEEGIYHYNIKNHTLEFIKKGKYAKQLAIAALGQNMVKNAAVNFIHIAIFSRSEWKYRNRTLRYILLDIGHIGQNLALSIT